ncbi:hypothetical protein GCM10025777_25500 [Membranihabitans marinus]
MFCKIHLSNVFYNHGNSFGEVFIINAIRINGLNKEENIDDILRHIFKLPWQNPSFVP